MTVDPPGEDERAADPEGEREENGQRHRRECLRELLRAHIDRIDMRSEPGDGSRFYRDATEIEEHT